MAQFDDAKVGDRVWDLRWGWGKIDRIESKTLTVKFLGNSFVSDASYWTDGRSMGTDLTPSLFWDEVTIVLPERPKEKCEACKLLDFAKWREKNTDRYTHADLKKDTFLLNQHHTCEKGE